MTTLYARSDIKQVAVASTGHVHKRKGNDPLAVSCAQCESELRRLGFQQDPRQVELTPDEELEAESARREIARFERDQVAAAAREAREAVVAGGRGRKAG